MNDTTFTTSGNEHLAGRRRGRLAALRAGVSARHARRRDERQLREILDGPDDGLRREVGSFLLHSQSS